MAAFTQAQVDAMKAAYARGVRSVSYGGRTTVYASLPEMAEAISRMEAEVGRNATTPRARQVRGYSNKGW